MEVPPTAGRFIQDNKRYALRPQRDLRLGVAESCLLAGTSHTRIFSGVSPWGCGSDAGGSIAPPTARGGAVTPGFEIANN